LTARGADPRRPRLPLRTGIRRSQDGAAGHKYAFIHTIAGALELGERIGTGNTGLLLDCWHWYTSHSTREDLARLRTEQVVYVHVNDAPPGRDIDEQIDNQRLPPGPSGGVG